MPASREPAKAEGITFDDDRGRVRVPGSALTHAGFRTWVTSDLLPSNVRASFIDSEVLIEAGREAIDTHNGPKTEVTRVLANIARDEDLGEVFAGGVLYTNEDVGLCTEPDVLFVSFGAVEQGRVRYVDKAQRHGDRAEVCGAPDLVVEVLSDASARKDDRLLRDAYARAGIAEYWIVDARGERVRFELLALEAGVYVPSAASRILRRSFTLRRAKNRVGRLSYVLQATSAP